MGCFNYRGAFNSTRTLLPIVLGLISLILVYILDSEFLTSYRIMSTIMRVLYYCIPTTTFIMAIGGLIFFVVACMVYILSMFTITLVTTCPEHETFDRWLEQMNRNTERAPDYEQSNTRWDRVIDSLLGRQIPKQLNVYTPKQSYHFGIFRLIICEWNDRRAKFLGIFNTWFHI